MQRQPSGPQSHIPRASRARLWLLLPLAAALGCNAVVHFSGCFNPFMASMMPRSATAGGLQFTLSVTGSNFEVNSVVMFNGNMLPTSFLSDRQLMATVPAAAISTPGTLQVSVVTPGGSSAATCQSNSLMFSVTN